MITRAVLAKRLKSVGLPYNEAIKCVDALLEIIYEELAQGGQIQLRGFGTFYTKKIAARKTAINNNMSVSAHSKVYFRPCEELRKAVWNIRKKA